MQVEFGYLRLHVYRKNVIYIELVAVGYPEGYVYGAAEALRNLLGERVHNPISESGRRPDALPQIELPKPAARPYGLVQQMLIRIDEPTREQRARPNRPQNAGARLHNNGDVVVVGSKVIHG